MRNLVLDDDGDMISLKGENQIDDMLFVAEMHEMMLTQSTNRIVVFHNYDCWPLSLLFFIKLSKISYDGTLMSETESVADAVQ